MAIKLPPFQKYFLKKGSAREFLPQTLYHYTRVDGVNGILLDCCLWATNFSFLNDPSEVEHGRRLVLKVLDEIQGISCDGSTTLKAIEDSLDRWILEVYVFSLTKLRDDLSQWRAYGSAGTARYCIGFDVEAILDLVPDKSTTLAEVLYEERKQREEVQWWIDRAIRATDEFPSESQDIIEFVARGLARLIPLLKSPAYAAEKEWRVIRWIPTSSDVSEVCFNTTRGIIRPYVKLLVPPPPPVTELIVLAPGREEISVKAAEMLLRKAGIKDVKAETSQVPFAE